MNQRAYFITGTDTNIGKTHVTKLLLTQFNQQGLSTIGLKPVSSGAKMTESGLENTDAIILQQSASVKIPLYDVNPFVFEAPIAPHLAAHIAGTSLTSNIIATNILNTMQKYCADRYLIEGVGGLLVPINDHETMVDLLLILNIPVILIVGIRLGCINHALLTSHAITNYKLNFAGWIANCIDVACNEQDKIITSLIHYLPAPCLQIIPFM